MSLSRTQMVHGRGKEIDPTSRGDRAGHTEKIGWLSSQRVLLSMWYKPEPLESHLQGGSLRFTT